MRILSVPAVVALLGALALSPAGASVRRLINRALALPPAATATLTLPAPGRLLVSGPGGTWTVAHDGASRRLGSWAQASWSPHGRYIAVSSAHGLAALAPAGSVAWRLTRSGVTDPRWLSPSGYRIAYLAAGDLNVVAGDGSGDSVLAAGVGAVAPAWRPSHPYQLAYLTGSGELVVRDAATRRVIWTAVPGAGRPLELSWSPAGDRLLLLGSRRARVYAADGRPLSQIRWSARAPALAGSLSPDGRTLALVRGGPAAAVQLIDLAASRPTPVTVLSGVGLRQPVWSPNGRWLLVTWPTADEWVFVRVVGGPRILAGARIAERFGARGGRRGLPSIDGWCCTAPASS